MTQSVTIVIIVVVNDPDIRPFMFCNMRQYTTATEEIDNGSYIIKPFEYPPEILYKPPFLPHERQRGSSIYPFRH